MTARRRNDGRTIVHALRRAIRGEMSLAKRMSLGEGGGDDTDPRGCGPWLVTVALAAVVFAAIRGAA
jgi:hypothetical protein